MGDPGEDATMIAAVDLRKEFPRKLSARANGLRKG